MEGGAGSVPDISFPRPSILQAPARIFRRGLFFDGAF